ncbi:MAG: TSUP family transporter [Candidatus Methylomirabilia bacterium]
MAATLSVLAVLLASFIKGAIGFGFPTVSTSILALFMDVRAAVVILILPNLAMDGILAFRRPGVLLTLKRHAILYAFGIVGTFVGTYLLKTISPSLALLILGGFVLVFVTINLSRVAFRVAPGLERLLSPPIGFLAGVLGGITNVPGTPLLLYFYALGMDKVEFVRSIAFSFLIYKAAQLVAITQARLVTPRLFALSVLTTGVGLGAFWLGLRVQDRVAQETFNRAVLLFLAMLGALLVVRAISAEF